MNVEYIKCNRLKNTKRYTIRDRTLYNRAPCATQHHTLPNIKRDKDAEWGRFEFLTYYIKLAMSTLTYVENEQVTHNFFRHSIIVIIYLFNSTSLSMHVQILNFFI